MRSVDLNFVRGRPAPAAAGVILLLLGAGAALASVVHFSEVAAEVDVWRARSEERAPAAAPGAPRVLEGRSGQAGVAAGAARDPRQLRQELERANLVLRQMSVPWEGLFTALEKASAREVALTAVHPDVTTRQMRLEGEAKSVGQALSFAERLGTSPLLEDVHLTGHERLDESDASAVRFLIAARWIDKP